MNISIHNIKRWMLLQKERLLWGGHVRENILLFFLERYYVSMIYRDWQLNKEPPHFFNQRCGFFLAGFSSQPNRTILPFLRGFYNVEIIQSNDVLLDIGCGDGFFTKKFFSAKCLSIDAMDIDKYAIATARRHHLDKKINYFLSDAVITPFPRNQYDMIIWDGAVGHFPSETTDVMLKKITKALKVNGVFSGSESLGIEGSDHLQFFNSLKDLSEVLKPHFKFIALKSVQYEISGGAIRNEAFWRCSDSLDRISSGNWEIFSN